MLDHETFPHIVEAVAEYASPQTQVVLRATSRQFCDLMDKMLAVHLVVRDNRVGTPALVWHPAFAGLNVRGRLVPSPGDSLDVTNDKWELRRERKAALQRLVATHTRVLDAEDSAFSEGYDSFRNASLPLIRLRPVNAPPQHRQAPCLKADAAVVRTPDPPHPPFSYPFRPLAVDTPRLTVVLDASQPCFPSILDTGLVPGEESGLRYLALVFVRPASDIIDARDRSLVRTSINEAFTAAYIDGSPVSFVNVTPETLPPDIVPHPASELDDYLTADPEGAYAAEFGMHLPPLAPSTYKRVIETGAHPLEAYTHATIGLEPSALARIRFMSLEEYAKEAGRERLHLELQGLDIDLGPK